MSAFLKRCFSMLTRRPAKIYQTLRGEALFALSTPIARFLWGRSTRIHLGQKVRVQNFGSLVSDGPDSLIDLGARSIIYENAQIEAYGSGKIRLGAGAVIGDVRIYSRHEVTIGQRALFSWNVFIQDYSPHPVSPEERGRQMDWITGAPGAAPWTGEFPGQAIQIGDDVWFGANTTILPGANIGSGCIIAAGAVVTKGQYPARSVLAGNPARVVKAIQ